MIRWSLVNEPYSSKAFLHQFIEHWINASENISIDHNGNYQNHHVVSFGVSENDKHEDESNYRDKLKSQVRNCVPWISLKIFLKIKKKVKINPNLRSNRRFANHESCCCVNFNEHTCDVDHKLVGGNLKNHQLVN